MIRLSAINRALKELGIKMELVKGEGYFYFVGEDCDDRESTSVMVYRLNQLTKEQWIEEARSLMKGID